MEGLDVMEGRDAMEELDVMKVLCHGSVYKGVTSWKCLERRDVMEVLVMA